MKPCIQIAHYQPGQGIEISDEAREALEAAGWESPDIMRDANVLLDKVREERRTLQSQLEIVYEQRKELNATLRQLKRYFNE